MRVLVLHAHPLGDSLHGALKATMVGPPQAHGREVDLCDLYAEGFEPALDAEARWRYFETQKVDK
ncbi:MAG: NAD(P)H-dependent oxidoreductase [Alphaproteobacteria bacterium]|nr:NAD(P)H-dependent oxidoreductase [Alphaproteobacteria bacterium]